MTRRPVLAAVIVEAEESDVPTVRYVVLTRPGGEDASLDVLIMTTTGELVLRGRGLIDAAASARVELRAVSVPGAIAVEVMAEVTLSGDGGAVAVTVTGRSGLFATTSRTPMPEAPTGSTAMVQRPDGLRLGAPG